MDFWQGTKVRLRGLEPADAEAFYEMNRDSEMSRYLDHVWIPTSLEYVRQWAAKTSVQRPDNDVYFWVIEDRDGEVVGSISSHHCDRRTGEFMYGVSIHREHQGRGYASEAIRLLLRYFFDELGYQKVTVDVYSNNLPSIRLHERLGFQLEGRVRRAVLTRGQRFDKLIYGMTVEEYRDRCGDVA